MIEKARNKKIGREEADSAAPVAVKEAPNLVVGTQAFFFPDYNLTIKADSRLEAEIKLAEYLAAQQ